jgi:hypothetical protein
LLLQALNKNGQDQIVDFFFFLLIHRTYSPLYFVIDGREGTRGSAAMQFVNAAIDGHEPMAMLTTDASVNVKAKA